MTHAHGPLGSTGYKRADSLLSSIVKDGLTTAAFVKAVTRIKKIVDDDTIPTSKRISAISELCSIVLGLEQVKDVSAGQE